jgi:hypothetical protein
MALLHLWRNPELDTDPWIGFTSYDQLEKFPMTLADRQEVESVLSSADVVGWGGYSFVDAISGRPVTVAEQAERFLPGFNSSLMRLIMLLNDPLPQSYFLATTGLFCNYWVMSKENFNEYMEWSSPLVFFALRNPDAILRQTPKALSHLCERLFICWYGLKEKRVQALSPIAPVVCQNDLFGAHLNVNAQDVSSD